ncbi:8479_t:CDS:2, partial [Dentiscutata erythropus]
MQTRQARLLAKIDKRPKTPSFYLSRSNMNHSLSSTNHPPSHKPTIPNPIIRDQIILYRILGNDLPPRHKAGQTLKNVRFILEHEVEFLNTKKWWLLNRIADSDYEDTLINLLRLHKQDYIRIPFNEDEYSKLDFRLEDFPKPDFFNSDEFARFSRGAKLRSIDYTYFDKNLYAMNN